MRKSLNVRCEFRLPDIADDEDYQCPYSSETSHGQLCIFHRPKLSKTEKASLSESELHDVEKMESAFEFALFDLIGKFESHDDAKINDSIDMRGFYFPSIHFKKAFSKKPDFSYATFVEYGDVETPKWRKQSSNPSSDSSSR